MVGPQKLPYNKHQRHSGKNEASVHPEIVAAKGCNNQLGEGRLKESEETRRAHHQPKQSPKVCESESVVVFFLKRQILAQFSEV